VSVAATNFGRLYPPPILDYDSGFLAAPAEAPGNITVTTESDDDALYLIILDLSSIGIDAAGVSLTAYYYNPLDVSSQTQQSYISQSVGETPPSGLQENSLIVAALVAAGTSVIIVPAINYGGTTTWAAGGGVRYKAVCIKVANG